MASLAIHQHWCAHEQKFRVMRQATVLAKQLKTCYNPVCYHAIHTQLTIALLSFGAPHCPS